MIEYKSSKNIILKHTNAVSSGTGSKLIPDTFDSLKITGVNNTDNDGLIGAAISSVMKATEIDTSSGGAVRCTYVEIDRVREWICMRRKGQIEVVEYKEELG